MRPSRPHRLDRAAVVRGYKSQAKVSVQKGPHGIQRIGFVQSDLGHTGP